MLLPALVISYTLAGVSCNSSEMKAPAVVRSTISPGKTAIAYTVKTELQHDATAYTQGLVYHEGKLYESTGADSSWLAEVNPLNGVAEKKVMLSKPYFGEGITVLNNKIYQLTWKHGLGFIYDASTLKQTGSFRYSCEGWGITTDGQHLIISDGTDKLYYLDTLSFAVVNTLRIKEHQVPVEKLNELEYINGFIFANQWETNYLLKIDPASQQVVGRLDLSPIANKIRRRYPEADVLNGIAYNPQTDELLITGKLWPRAYLLQLNE